MCPLYIPILWALLFLVRGNDLDFEEEIFTRPGSDLLLPIRHHLTLNHPDTERCDEFAWTYVNSSGDWEGIAVHSDCKLYDFRHFPNTRISENGSLIISNVTLENDGRYFVIIYNSAGGHIQKNDYIVHVEGNVLSAQEEIFTRPGSDLLLPIRRRLTLNHTDRWRCDRFTWAYVNSSGDWKDIAGYQNCDLSDLRYFPNTRISENGSLIISNVTLENDGTYSVDIYSKEQIIHIDFYTVHVEEESQSGMWSGWGHLLSSGAVFVLYTALLIFMVNDLRKMKNEKNRSERRTRRRDQMEMEMEPTYYDDCD